MKSFIRNICILLVSSAPFVIGCAIITDSLYESLLQKPSSQWNIDECRIVFGRSLAHNVKVEDAPMHVFALPFSPMVITALNREEQLKKHWTDDEYQANIQVQAKECLGMFVDWKTDTYIDPHGSLFRDVAQMDSVLFLITFDNFTEPVFINVVTTGPVNPDHNAVIGNSVNWFGPLPDLTEFATRVFLQNAAGEKIPPRLVWMRKRELVSKAESILAMFDLRQGDKHFLEGSDQAQIVVTGFSRDVRLPYRLASGQFQAMNLH